MESNSSAAAIGVAARSRARAVATLGALVAAGALAAIFVLAASCASTRLRDVYRNPQVGQLKFQRVVAIALVRNEGRRHLLEDSMVAEIAARTGARPVPGYTILSQSDIRDEERVKDIVAREGFDGAVMMRYRGSSTETTYVPGTAVWAPAYYRSFWGYYRHWVPIVYEPGYLETDRIVRVETLVYSVKDDTLVWSGLSETLNPDSSADLVRSIAKEVVDDMKDHGLLKS